VSRFDRKASCILGGSPYPGIPVEKLFELLKMGYRMESPQGCPLEMYEMFLQCWYENPHERPSFKDICNRLESYLENLTDSEYLEILADMPLKHESNDNSDDCDSTQRLCDELSEGDDHVFEDSELKPLQCSFRLQDNGIEESDV